MREQIKDMLTEIAWKKPLTKEERAVMHCLHMAWEENKQRKVTQRDIAASERWLGCVPEYERTTGETTLRKVRKIVRDLRIVHGAPILSDRVGYWIPSTREEVELYLERLAGEAKAQAKAWYETYDALHKTFAIESEYFKAQERLL